MLLASDVLDEINARISAVQLPSLLTTPPAEPARQRGILRLAPKKYDQASLIGLSRELRRWGASLPSEYLDVRLLTPNISVFEATERFYSQPSTCGISHMLDCAIAQRGAINFNCYGCSSFDPLIESPRTIEIRIGQGSLDGYWVSTWAKIITGLFRFAIYSSLSDFIDLMEKCERATEVDGAYDIVDLLDDIGLFAEAVIVEERLKAHKDEWNLEFVEPKA